MPGMSGRLGGKGSLDATVPEPIKSSLNVQVFRVLESVTAKSVLTVLESSQVVGRGCYGGADGFEIHARVRGSCPDRSDLTIYFCWHLQIYVYALAIGMAKRKHNGLKHYGNISK